MFQVDYRSSDEELDAGQPNKKSKNVFGHVDKFFQEPASRHRPIPIPDTPTPSEATAPPGSAVFDISDFAFPEFDSPFPKFLPISGFDQSFSHPSSETLLPDTYQQPTTPCDWFGTSASTPSAQSVPTTTPCFFPASSPAQETAAASLSHLPPLHDETPRNSVQAPPSPHESLPSAPASRAPSSPPTPVTIPNPPANDSQVFCVCGEDGCLDCLKSENLVQLSSLMAPPLSSKVKKESGRRPIKAVETPPKRSEEKLLQSDKDDKDDKLAKGIDCTVPKLRLNRSDNPIGSTSARGAKSTQGRSTRSGMTPKERLIEPHTASHPRKPPKAAGSGKTGHRRLKRRQNLIWLAEDLLVAATPSQGPTIRGFVRSLLKEPVREDNSTGSVEESSTEVSESSESEVPRRSRANVSESGISALRSNEPNPSFGKGKSKDLLGVGKGKSRRPAVTSSDDSSDDDDYPRTVYGSNDFHCGGMKWPEYTRRRAHPGERVVDGFIVPKEAVREYEHVVSSARNLGRDPYQKHSYAVIPAWKIYCPTQLGERGTEVGLEKCVRCVLSKPGWTTRCLHCQKTHPVADFTALPKQLRVHWYTFWLGTEMAPYRRMAVEGSKIAEQGMGYDFV